MNAPTENQRKDADRDAQAMSMMPAKQRDEMLRSLLADPLTHYFADTVVKDLLKQLDDERYFKGRAQATVIELNGKLSRLQAAPMPKSKAIIKQAKVIARLAECISEVNDVIEEYAEPGTEIETVLRGWQRNYPDLIEGANDGD